MLMIPNYTYTLDTGHLRLLINHERDMNFTFIIIKILGPADINRAISDG